MVSDDTEHTVMVLQSLWEADGSVDRFQRVLANGLKIWFLLLPAGVGFATLKACLRLLVGVPPSKSGVPSAGNGPAMRASIIGCFYAEDPCRRIAFVEASSRLTHTDERAVEGAQIVALAASYRARDLDLDGIFIAEAANLASSLKWQPVLAGPVLKEDIRGIGGYVVSTVEACLAVCREHQTGFENAMNAIIRAGGDTDSTAAIVGGIIGSAGRRQIPDQLVEGLCEWPRGVSWMTRLSEGPVATFWPGLALRNLVFLLVVLFHGFRRLFPPY